MHHAFTLWEYVDMGTVKCNGYEGLNIVQQADEHSTEETAITVD